MAGLVSEKATHPFGARLREGWYIAGLAPKNPQVNYLGVDLKDVVLAPAKRIVEAAFAGAGRPVDNVGLTAYNVEQICNMLRPEDGVARICINFCNPWPRAKHNKRRLTHPRRLNDYSSSCSRAANSGLRRTTTAYLPIP